MNTANGGSCPPLQVVFATLVYPAAHHTTQRPNLDVQPTNPLQDDVIEVEAGRCPCIAKWAELLLMECSPSAYVWGSNSLHECSNWINETSQDTLQGPNLNVQGRTTPQNVQVLDDDIFEDLMTSRSACIQKWIQSLLMVCCPIGCFWGLNLMGVANTRLQSVTLRMYFMKLVALLLENSVHRVSEAKLKGVGRRTKHVFFSVIFGLVAAVLTTISQIDGRADGECGWGNDLPRLPNCRALRTEVGASGSPDWSVATQFKSAWCCGMVRDGDYLGRKAILSSAAMACSAALWGWLAAALTGNAAITFAGCGYLAAGSAFLLGWGSRGDEDGEWLLFAITWLATLVPQISMLASPLPFSYDCVAVTGGMITSTSHVRRALAWTAVVADAAVLPAVPGGAIAAMCVVMAARIALALAVVAANTFSTSCARARAERAALSPALRAADAADAVRRGLVTCDGRIAAAHVIEFDPAGPQTRWRWILKDGERRGRFAVRPFDEYRLGSVPARPDGAGPPV